MRHAREDYNGIQETRNRDRQIPDDEPVFLLRGQNKIAWRIVALYADWAQAAGCDRELVNKCRDQSELMRTWSNSDKGKIPDL